MPHKIRSLNETTYGYQWRKKRLAVLRQQPLCALCLAAGKTVAAAVVDHKVPLSDGGTNDSSNLQPLCKRCHDNIKTPLDVKIRGIREANSITMFVAWIGDTSVITPPFSQGLDMRLFRKQCATTLGWNEAHRITLGAIEGICRFAQTQPIQELCVIFDDLAHALWCKASFSVDIVVQPMGDAIPLSNNEESIFLAERFGVEYVMRQKPQRGEQPARA